MKDIAWQVIVDGISIYDLTRHLPNELNAEIESGVYGWGETGIPAIILSSIALIGAGRTAELPEYAKNLITFLVQVCNQPIVRLVQYNRYGQILLEMPQDLNGIFTYNIFGDVNDPEFVTRLLRNWQPAKRNTDNTQILKFPWQGTIVDLGGLTPAFANVWIALSNSFTWSQLSSLTTVGSLLLLTSWLTMIHTQQNISSVLKILTFLGPRLVRVEEFDAGTRNITMVWRRGKAGSLPALYEGPSQEGLNENEVRWTGHAGLLLTSLHELVKPDN